MKKEPLFLDSLTAIFYEDHPYLQLYVLQLLRESTNIIKEVKGREW